MDIRVIDEETGFYFLQTRYYDPEVGRFLNMDSIDYVDPETINGLNLYAYCNNNPVSNIDPSGTSVISFSAFATMFEYLNSASLAVMAGIS